METFIAVLRSVHRETEERHDHLDIFREFLDHLGRSVRRGGAGARRTNPDLRFGAAPRSASLSGCHHAAAGINDHVALE